MEKGIFKLGDLVELADWVDWGVNVDMPLLIISDEGTYYRAMYMTSYLDGLIRPLVKGTDMYKKVGSIFEGGR